MSNTRASRPDPWSRKVLGLRVSALVETVLLIAIIVFMDASFGPGDRFFHAAVHPFWIPVLLVSAQYGLEDGLFAAAASSVVLIAFNVPPPAPGVDIIDQALALARNPAMWTLAALAVGGLAERHISRADGNERRARMLEDEVRGLRHSVERLSQANDSLATRAAGQLKTFASLYEAAKALDGESPAQVLMGAARLVRAALNANEYSIFLLNGTRLEAALCEGWHPQSRRIRALSPGMPLYDQVITRRAVLHAASTHGEALLAHQGVLAGPIQSPATGRVVGMLKIERMPFEEFTPAAVHNFRALCDWLGAALARAEDFRTARATSFLASDGALLSNTFMTRAEALLTRLAERENFALAALDIEIESMGARREQVSKLLAEATAAALRGTDLAFEGARGTGAHILLPGATGEAARAVAERFERALERLRRVGGIAARAHIAIRLIRPEREAA